MIRILYFASLRERLGKSSEEMELSSSISNVRDLLTILRERGGDWAEVLSGDQSVLCAINQEMAKPDSAIQDGDEVGLFPPVTGG